MLKNIFTLLLCVLSASVAAQHLKHIPDENLKRALDELHYLRNDSLDTDKIKDVLELELNTKGIKNLDGLHYFKKVRRLELNHNNIKRLNYLPPNLKVLHCTNNKIKVVNDLPKKLKTLNCSNNRIHTLENLPDLLESINFSTNNLSYLPVLPTKKLDFLNYYNNPIPYNSLGTAFKKMGCDNAIQNFMPNKLRRWGILNHNIKDLYFGEITKIQIEFGTSYIGQIHSSGGEFESLTYSLTNNLLIANEMNTKETIYYYDTKETTKTEMVTPIYWTVETSKIKTILNDIYSNKLAVKAPLKDGFVLVNLENKKWKLYDVVPTESGSSHDTSHNLTFTFFTTTNTIKLNYHFEGGTIDDIPSQDTRPIINWLYAYKLVRLCFSNHEQLNDVYFNENMINRIIEWQKEYDKKL